MSDKFERFLLPSLAGLNLNKGSKSTGVFVFDLLDNEAPLKLSREEDGQYETVDNSTVYEIKHFQIARAINAFVEEGNTFFASSSYSIRARFLKIQGPEIRIFTSPMAYGFDYGEYSFSPQEIVSNIERAYMVFSGLDFGVRCDSRVCYFDIPLDPSQQGYDKYVHAAAAMFDSQYRTISTTKRLGVRAHHKNPIDVASMRDKPFQKLRQKYELELMLYMASNGVSPELKCAFLSESVDYSVGGEEEVTPNGVVSITEGGWVPLAKRENLLTAAATEIQQWHIRNEMLKIVNTLSKIGYIVGSIDSDNIVCKPIEGDANSFHSVRIASFDPLFVFFANVSPIQDERTSEDCLYFVNSLLFLNSALAYPIELRNLLMREIALNAVAKWSQMAANGTLEGLCSYLNIDPRVEVPEYVHLGGLPPEGKFPIVNHGNAPETAVPEAFQYSIRGFNRVIPSGGGDGYMRKILNYLKNSYNLEDDAVKDRVSELNASWAGGPSAQRRRRF